MAFLSLLIIQFLPYLLSPYCTVLAFALLYRPIGLVVRTRQPTAAEMGDFGAPNLKAFRNRQGCYGTVAIAACNANCEFVFSANQSGSTNDVAAIKSSAGGGVLLSGLYLRERGRRSYCQRVIIIRGWGRGICVL